MVRKIQELEWKDMKNIEVKFPLIEDITMDVANAYGMISQIIHLHKQLEQFIL